MAAAAANAPFASVVVNGRQIITVTLPTIVGQITHASAPAVVEVLDAELLRGGGFGGGGGFVLDLIFLSPNITPQRNVRVRGELVVDKQHIRLGSIRTRREHVRTTRIVRGAPQQDFKVRLRAELIDRQQAPVTVEEQALVRELHRILEDPSFNPRHGGVCSERLRQELMRKCRLYPLVIQPRGSAGLRTWAEFLKRHKDRFRVFQYSKKELKNRGLLGEIEPNKDRVTIQSDARHHSPHEKDEGLKEFLVRILSDADMRHLDVLKALTQNRQLSHCLSPAFTQLMRVLERNKSTFSWTTHPGEPTRIRLKPRKPPDSPDKPDSESTA
eukprot:TRINITY_DN7280_c0_g1_i1.p1 TRINITY_DN7280_c0_g1~~TRINITY_DN7280_c0_g1_i1.p1  ORF type:complete len:328 (+),score=83.47 TRINITY_DN7280_c0_g1_i1:56-1039(+)